MANDPIIIGSRGSKLALWQAHFVQKELEKINHPSKIKIIKTEGDRIQHLSFDKMEGKGFFTKEIEAALLNKEIDIAVHSHKDLETTEPEGLEISAVTERAALHDLLVINQKSFDAKELFGLKKNAVVGTSSARRKVQMAYFRNDVSIKDLRGNVPTRLDKLRNNHYDGIILAAAGVERLEIDLSEFEWHHFDPKKFIPAPAQGAMAVQVRSKDNKTRSIIHKLNCEKVAQRVEIERAVLKGMNGGCQMPLGAYCLKENDLFQLYIAYASNANTNPEHFYLENQNAARLIEEALSQLRG